jgi:hypothetical protein
VRTDPHPPSLEVRRADGPHHGHPLRALALALLNLAREELAAAHASEGDGTPARPSKETSERH